MHSYINMHILCKYVYFTAIPKTNLSSVHERLPEILVVPREKTPTGAAARGNP